MADINLIVGVSVLSILLIILLVVIIKKFFLLPKASGPISYTKSVSPDGEVKETYKIKLPDIGTLNFVSSDQLSSFVNKYRKNIRRLFR